jgi:RNA polymerase sigma-70 factor (ECF subfamily)
MSFPDTEIDEFVRRATEGDREALDRLLHHFRARLRRMVAIRMDQRLIGRVDPSDVVQETLAEAARKLHRYAAERRLPFYPWLRELAREHLVRLHRQHVKAGRRTVLREELSGPGLSQESVMELARQLAATGTSPSGQAMREEMRQRVRAALTRLTEQDQEILVMRHLEQLEVGEIAAILGISEKAAMMRRLRAFERLRRLLNTDRSEA